MAMPRRLALAVALALVLVLAVAGCAGARDIDMSASAALAYLKDHQTQVRSAVVSLGVPVSRDASLTFGEPLLVYRMPASGPGDTARAYDSVRKHGYLVPIMVDDHAVAEAEVQFTKRGPGPGFGDSAVRCKWLSDARDLLVASVPGARPKAVLGSSEFVIALDSGGRPAVVFCQVHGGMNPNEPAVEPLLNKVYRGDDAVRMLRSIGYR